MKTPSGICASLRHLVASDTMSSSSTVPLLFVTALPEERDAMLARLEDPRPATPPVTSASAFDANEYYEASVPNERWGAGRVRVSVLCLAGMGRVRAAVQAANAIHTLQPAAVVLVGIAGGVRKAVKELGAVIVSEQIVDYELQKLTDEDDQIRFEVYRGDQALLRITREVAMSWKPEREFGRGVSVSIGPIASGDKVVASSDDLDKLLFQWPKLLGIEMEAGGAAAAAWFAPSRPRFLMIRGVSDFADNEKNTEAVDSQRPHACATAALFAAEFARRLPEFPTSDGVKSEPVGLESKPDAERQALVEQLDRLKNQLLLLKLQGEDTSEIREQILDVRRELRRGRQLTVGQHLGLGRYELLEKLGSGGFGTVWKAADRRTFDAVAIKVLHGQWAQDQTRIRRFERGASQMQRLAHPNVVRVLEEAQEEDGFRYFVMELLDGGTFEEVILDGSVGEDQAKDILLDIGDALSYAHANRAIHRDVKPRNILLTQDGRAKLTDFDLVRSIDTTGGTREGPLGTIVYSAPECLLDASIADERCDVYSLAMVTLFSFRRKKLGIEALRDTPDLIDACSVPAAVKAALHRATDWVLPKRTTTVKKFCDALRRGAVMYAGGNRDLPAWLRKSGFTDTCRTAILASYSELRARRDWLRIEVAISHHATRLLTEWGECLHNGQLPFGDSRPAVTAFNSVSLSNPDLDYPHDLEKSDERAIKWLIVRRVILGIVKQFRTALEHDPGRLEALMIASLNFAPVDDRGDDFISGGSYKRYSTAFRPTMTGLGLKVSDLAKGLEGLSTLGHYEEQWLESVVGAWPHEFPPWWP